MVSQGGHAWLMGDMHGCGGPVWLPGGCALVAVGMHGCAGVCLVMGGMCGCMGGVHGCWGGMHRIRQDTGQ